MRTLTRIAFLFIVSAICSTQTLAQSLNTVKVNVMTLSGVPVSDVLVEAYNGIQPTGIGSITDLAGGAKVSLPVGGNRFRLLVDGKQYYTKANGHCSTSTCKSITYVIPPDFSDQRKSDSRATPDQLPVKISSLSLGEEHSPSSLRSGSMQAMMGEGGLLLTLGNPNAPTVNLFGFDLAEQRSSNEAIVSALNYDPVLDEYNGHVYLIDVDTQAAILDITSPNTTGEVFFGWTVASLANGDIVVSDFAEDVSGVPAGVVYIFDGTTGVLKQTIANPNPSADDHFGYAVEVTTNDHIAIGAPKEGAGGAVYVYSASGVLQQTIVNPTIDLGADFGRSIASNSYGELVIGAPVQHVTLGSTTYFAAGAVYQYTELTGVQQVAIDNPNPADADLYGQVVATLSTDEIVVSSILYDSATTDEGYLFVHDEQTGQLIWGLPNPIADFEGWFANTLVGTPDGNLLVGASRNDLGATNAGRVFVFDGSGNLIKTLDNPSPSAGEEFGKGLAVATNSVIGVGAFLGEGFAGAVYFYAPVIVGDNLTLLNDLSFGDVNLASCIQSDAAGNGWAIADELTTLSCINEGITDLTGIDALTSLLNLDLTGNDITDLSALASLASLQTVDLTGNDNLLCSDIYALELALPSAVITWPATCGNAAAVTSQVQSLHNAQGQRAVKTVNNDPVTTIHFIYNQSGQVLAEIDATTGATLREYIYVNGMQVALVDDTNTAIEATYFVHNDHLGTPQKITDSTQEVVWGGNYDPFGEVESSVAYIENNIRFPGQYEDGETGLHYNYFRDYDPSLGRYVESDPIGLIGGLATYNYAFGNPPNLSDPTGLISLSGSAGIGANIPVTGIFGIGFDLSITVIECCNANRIEQRIFGTFEFGFSAGGSIKGGGGLSLGPQQLASCRNKEPDIPRFRTDLPGLSLSDKRPEIATQVGAAFRVNVIREPKLLFTIRTDQCC